MRPQKTRRVISVFLASPGDVVLERSAAIMVVNRLNKSVGASLGWHVELHRWEDTKPAYGRPQSIINSAVDACDLFIGLLWERWGQPTGEYTSGFHEEFELVRKRRESTGEPEIWLVFKAPSKEKLQDPGAELTKVLTFRDTQKSVNQVLFREVMDTADWQTNLHDWLLEYVLERNAAFGEAMQRTPTEAGQGASEPLRLAESDPQVPGQLVELSSKISRVISSGNLEFTPSDARVLEEFDVARLYLLAATWMANRNTSHVLGTHEVNLLYKYRNRLKVTWAEEYQLLRAVLLDIANVVPGWFWFRETFDNPSGRLLFIAAYDSNPELQVRALKLMVSARIQISPKLWLALPTSDESQDVSVEAFKYLGLFGDESAFALIEKTLEGHIHPLVFDAAAEAKLQILSRINPELAFHEWLSAERDASAELVRAFSDEANVLASADLVKGTTSDVSAIKDLSVRELARRGELTLEIAEGLRQDDSPEIKQAALQVIINNRGQVELDKLKNAVQPLSPHSTLSALLGNQQEVDLSLVELNYYRTLRPEELLKKITWSAIDGPSAYRVLAEDHFDQISAFIRSDLDAGFERIRAQYAEELKEQFSVEVAQRILQTFQKDKIDEFIRSMYTEAALIGLAPHSMPSDLSIARRYMRDDRRNTSVAAVRIVSQLGDARDVKTLLDISENAWGELKELAVESAIRLSPQPLSLALEMAHSSDATRNKIARDWLICQDSADVRDYFRGLLNDESPAKREQGLLYLVRKLNRVELEQLLEEYLAQETYYYNIVTWIDRIAFAPPPLDEMFTRHLGQSE